MNLIGALALGGVRHLLCSRIFRSEIVGATTLLNGRSSTIDEYCLLEDHVHRVHSNRRREETVTLTAMKICKTEPDRLRGVAGAKN
uniref:AlNc14C29G2745 protein n=1 Tax=Albugo laibachii Nc14 TaxID=890382 RepID=F0W7C5_9STRA|nr:AlNc14C29G2745 [Albugo laibachii Nc14]|eukprot:CCA17024.1 AlNc14C29G2745 [Albugo laibachii Nc14]